MPRVIEMLQSPNTEGMGVEPDSTAIGVVYNRQSKCVIARYGRLINGIFPIEEIYFRREDERRYRKVQVEGVLSLKDPVSCRSSPCVIVNAYQMKIESGGADWGGIYRLALPEGELTKILDSTTLIPPPEYFRAWVSSIIELDDVGQKLTLTCATGLQRATGPHTSIVDYWICDIDLTSGALRRVAELPYTFA